MDLIMMIQAARSIVRVCGALFIIIYLSMSAARVYTVLEGFAAPIGIWQRAGAIRTTALVATTSTANESEKCSWRNINVCVGKEWFRFPSSFWLQG